MRHPTTRNALVAALCLALTTTAIGCTPSLATSHSANVETDNATTALTADWSTDTDCAACHSKEGSSLQSTECVAGSHSASQGLQCVTCHNDESTLSQVHASAGNKKAPKRLKKTEVNADVCLSCHDMETLAAATADFTGLTDSQGTTVNPHDLPRNEDHSAEISCTSCHSGHGDNSPSEQATDLCVGCHHENVYECGTCH